MLEKKKTAALCVDKSINDKTALGKMEVEYLLAVIIRLEISFIFSDFASISWPTNLIFINERRKENFNNPYAERVTTNNSKHCFLLRFNEHCVISAKWIFRNGF